MSITLHLKAFFFNAKTDYLPYYKMFTVSLPDDAAAKDLLIEIKRQNENFAYPEKKLIFKINELMVDGNVPVAALVERLGVELKIDPANSYRSCDGLIINDDDFMSSYALLAPYATDEDKKHYKTLYALHYASETEKFEHEYIGDAVLLLAHRMIENGNVHKKEILQVISSANSGLFDCEYENNLFNEEYHAEAISALKKMIRSYKEENNSPLDILRRRFAKNSDAADVKDHTKRETVTLENLNQKHVAYYAGADITEVSATNKSKSESIDKLLERFAMKSVVFGRSSKLSGLTILEDNRTLAFRKAGAILLDAYDSGSEVVVIEEDEAYYMMKKNFAKIEKVMGREMKGLELISATDLKIQLEATAA